MEYNQSTYGRSYPQGYYVYPHPSHQQQWEPYYQPWNSYDQASVHDVDAMNALAARMEALQKQMAQMQMASVAQVMQICDICGGGHQNHECQSGNVNLVEGNIESANFVSNFCRNNDPYSNTYNPGWRNHREFAWNNNNANTQQAKQFQLPGNDFEAPVPMYPPEFQNEAQRDVRHDDTAQLRARLEALEQERSQDKAYIKNLERLLTQMAAANPERQQGALPSDTEQDPREQENYMTLRSGKEVEGPPKLAELKEKEKELEEESSQQGEVESMVEAIEEGKDEVDIEQFEEFPIEKPLETRVEETKEIGYSNFELDMFVIPPYVPSQHLELKILLGQVKGKDKWLIQIKIYFLEATKGKEMILSSTSKFFLFSMKHGKGKKIFMHGWANFPFDPGGVNLWSG